MIPKKGAIKLDFGISFLSEYNITRIDNLNGTGPICQTGNKNTSPNIKVRIILLVLNILNILRFSLNLEL